MIVVYDGVCKLCNGWVKFLLPRDRRHTLRFASIQSEAGRALLRKHGYPAENLDTLLVLQGDRLYIRTAAIFQVLNQLGGIYRLAWLAWLIPAPIRDFAYTRIALNRYRWFGKYDSCLVPGPEDAARFIETTEQLESR